MFWSLQARRKKYDQLEGSSEGYAGQEWDDRVQLIGPEQLRTRLCCGFLFQEADMSIYRATIRAKKEKYVY